VRNISEQTSPMPHLRPKQQRPQNKWRIAVAVPLMSVIAAACSGSPLGALEGKTPTAIVSLSVVAFHHESSFHFVTKTVQGSHSETQVGDVSRTAAAETIVSDGKPVIEAELSHGTEYLRAGSQLLENVLHLPSGAATAHAGSWLSVGKGDAPYPDILSTLTPTSAIQLFVPQEPNLHIGGATRFSGKSAVAVEGFSPVTPPSGDVARVIMFVSPDSPFLPIGATLVVTNAKGKVIEQEAALYGKWNERLVPVVPKAATSFASLSKD
jgi:hypothetical protein